MSKLGIIGGSGLYELEGVKIKECIEVDTPFGKPSDNFYLVTVDGKEVVFLSRHGKGHKISPSAINYRANIYGMKSLGVDTLISVSACGSLKEEIKPLDFVIPLQFIDRTNQARKYTFFDQNIVVHTGFAHPICKSLAESVLKIAKENSPTTVHFGGTYINMEGPQFSTLAESKMYRSLGIDIIGMTTMTEARLAREAEMCYCTLAAVTDYDCWHPDHDSVTVDIVMDNLRKNVENSKKIILNLIKGISSDKDCSCQQSLKYSIVTSPDVISEDEKNKYKLLIGKYIS